MPAISVNNISKKFRLPHHRRTTLFQNAIGLVKRQMAYEEFWALKGISFEVEKGETFGIIGRNGSGKSTLLKILARVLYPDSGTIIINGNVASFLELGVGFQPELTAAENIYIYASVLGMSRRETGAVYDRVLDFAELKKFEDMKLKNFSSGMYARLAFSTAVNCNPDIMLVDEVLAVGDEAFQKKSMAKIDEFREMGKTIIFVSHSQSVVRKICARSILLHNGETMCSGNTASVIRYYMALLNPGDTAFSEIPFTIDWDGDGEQEVAVFRQGIAVVQQGGGINGNGNIETGPFGEQPGDRPVAVDWDGDGRQELAIFRREGEWLIDIDGDGLFKDGTDLHLGPFGQQPGDIPLSIDWDGDGREELAIYRQGQWFIDLNHSGRFEPEQDVMLGIFGGLPGDIPLAIDWDGDGKDELAIFRQNGTLLIDSNRNGTFEPGSDLELRLTRHKPGDIPVVKKSKVAGDRLLLYRPDGAQWYIDASRDGVFKPITGA